MRRDDESGRISRVVAISILVRGLVAATSSVGCRSVPKAELQERLAALEKNRAMAEPVRTPMVLSDGGQKVQLAYVHEVARDPSSERLPVVLVHGTPSTLYSWVELIHGVDERAGLPEKRDVYAIEVLGHGFASGESEAMTFGRAASFVVDAIRTLDVGPVHLVGSSYGGEFVWRAALEAPDSIASITLLDSSGYPRREGDWLSEEIEMRENPLAYIGWWINSPERIESALAPHFDRIPPDRVQEFYLVCANRANWRAMVDLCRDENGSRSTELSSLQVPALLIWGADDIAYPPEHYAQRFADDIPDARLEVLDGTGHYPHEQHPKRVLDLLESFFPEVESTR